jgi:hypothetical protein
MHETETESIFDFPPQVWDICPTGNVGANEEDVVGDLTVGEATGMAKVVPHSRRELLLPHPCPQLADDFTCTDILCRNYGLRSISRCDRTK